MNWRLRSRGCSSTLPHLLNHNCEADSAPASSLVPTAITVCHPPLSQAPPYPPFCFARSSCSLLVNACQNDHSASLGVRAQVSTARGGPFAAPPKCRRE
jgi:hypothetical protein